MSTARAGGARGGAEAHPGQGRRQLDLAQGRRGGVPRPGAAGPRYGAAADRDGVRRAGAGRHGRAEGGDLRARDTFSPSNGLPRRGRHLRPERARRSRRASRRRRLREGVHRGGCRWPNSAVPVRVPPAASRTSSFSFRGNDVVREAMHAAFLFPRRPGPGSTWASSTPASSRCTRASHPSCEHVEDVIGTAGPSDRAHGRNRERVQGEGAGRELDLSGGTGVEKRLQHALMAGTVDFVEADTEEARQVRPARSR